MHLARRIIVIWAIDALALWLLVPVVPGLELSTWVWAIWAIGVIGLLNALVRPFLLWVMLPFTVLSLGLLSVVLNAFIILLADLALPGFSVSDIVAAVWTVLGIALVNTVVTGLLSINDDESFFRNVIMRFARESKSEQQTNEPGMAILEIDGLSKPALDAAIEAGYMPVLSRWIENGWFRVSPWSCGLPSQTSSSQAGILYGRNENIPAFRWYEKSEKRMMISNRPWHAAEIHQRLSDGTGLLAGDGSSLTNVVSGDAPNTAMTLSSLLDGAGALRQRNRGYYLLFLNPYSFSRMLVLTVWELLREIGQRLRGSLRRSKEPHTRGGSFIFLRAAANVFLREINLYLLIEDMLKGTRIIYSTFLGYDVVAHHAGPLHQDALRTLKHLDEGLEALERATKRAPRRYDLVLLSDHGQSPGATFKQRYGLTLDQLVSEALGGQENVVGPPDEDESWAHLNALLSQAIQVENVAGRTVRRMLRQRTRDGYVELVPAAELPIERETEVVVSTSGNLGLVYFTERDDRVTLEELTVRYPRFISRLVGHPGIGFVLVRSGLYGTIVIGRSGINYLDLEQVDGVDPLRHFGDEAVPQLKRLDGFSNVGDLVINSTYFPDTGEVAAFEDLVGSHGGIGGDQTSAFVLYPASWPGPEEPISSPNEMNRVLRDWFSRQSMYDPGDALAEEAANERERSATGSHPHVPADG